MPYPHIPESGTRQQARRQPARSTCNHEQHRTSAGLPVAHSELTGRPPQATLRPARTGALVRHHEALLMHRFRRHKQPQAGNVRPQQAAGCLPLDTPRDFSSAQSRLLLQQAQDECFEWRSQREPGWPLIAGRLSRTNETTHRVGRQPHTPCNLLDRVPPARNRRTSAHTSAESTRRLLPSAAGGTASRVCRQALRTRPKARMTGTRSSSRISVPLSTFRPRKNRAPITAATAITTVTTTSTFMRHRPDAVVLQAIGHTLARVPPSVSLHLGQWALTTKARPASARG